MSPGKGVSNFLEEVGLSWVFQVWGAGIGSSGRKMAFCILSYPLKSKDFKALVCTAQNEDLTKPKVFYCELIDFTLRGNWLYNMGNKRRPPGSGTD